MTLTSQQTLQRRPVGGDGVGVHPVPGRNLLAFLAVAVGVVNRGLLRPGRVVVERHRGGFLLDRRPREDDVVDFFGGARGGVEETLSVVAAEVYKDLTLARPFHTLSYDSQVERM